MITIFFSATIRSGMEQEFEELIAKISHIARTEDAGCESYVWLKQKGLARSYSLFEQWTDQAALDAHVRHLHRLVGSPATGAGLPSAITELFETSEAAMYEVIG